MPPGPGGPKGDRPKGGKKGGKGLAILGLFLTLIHWESDWENTESGGPCQDFTRWGLRGCGGCARPYRTLGTPGGFPWEHSPTAPMG